MVTLLENLVTPSTMSSQPSQILPNPSKHFSKHLNSPPFPTHSFFHNFIAGNSDNPVFLHPYLLKLSSYGFSCCYPSLTTSATDIGHTFTDDFTVSASNSSRHLVSSYNDLTVTIDFEANGIRLFLSRGSPYITMNVTKPLCMTFACKSDIKSVNSMFSDTKQKVELENNQCWFIYASNTLKLKKNDKNKLVSTPFVGIIRVAINPNSNASNEEMLDQYRTCYATNGEAIFSSPFSIDYKWETKGWGELLMLAHPLHLKLISSIYSNSEVRVLKSFKYKSIDGDLVGVVGSKWSLRAPNVPITWHSLRGIPECYRPEIVRSLWKDVGELDSSSINTNHILYYGCKVFRAARLALIAEEVDCMDVIPTIRKFLRDAINPWLNNKFEGNGFVYETIWGGILSKQGIADKNADLGFGFFDQFHFLGYFVYAISVLAKVDPDWGMKFRNQAFELVGSFMSLGRTANPKNARLRHFDLYKLHSWNGAATGDCSSHHSSEIVMSYYAASLLGMAFGDDHMVGIGSTLASFEIEAIKTWFHVKEGGVYGAKFSNTNKFVGISMRCKRESRLFFAPSEHKEIRVGMHVLPLLPITEILFSDVDFAKAVVDWATPALARKGAADGWNQFVHALEALYDKDSAIKKIKNLKSKTENDGHCLTSFLWWVHSRGDQENFCCWCRKAKDECWFCGYCG